MGSRKLVKAGRGFGSILISSLMLFSQLLYADSFELHDLRVERRENPMGLDVTVPTFGWTMQGGDDVRGIEQVAYQLQVTDPRGDTMWDSGKRRDGSSQNIVYSGKPLGSETRYNWSVTVWDNLDSKMEATAWFETGLMNPEPDSGVWEGAKWIGTEADNRALFAFYQPIFDLTYEVTIVPGSDRASVIFAANDPRLMDPNKNIYQLQNAINESYFKVELDIAGLGDEDGHALLKVYRAGYSASDDPSTPVSIFKIRREIIDANNRHLRHRVSIRDEFGNLTFTVNGSNVFHVPLAPDGSDQDKASVNLNPAGLGWDYITYGLLCEIGFSVDPGQKALFSDLSASNTRKPARVLFREDLDEKDYQGIFQKFIKSGSALRITDQGYQIDGGNEGAFIVADPSHSSMPMLRTTFGTDDRTVASARLYVTARGIYELYLNGQRVGDDYYNPGLSQYNRTHFYQTYDVTDLVNKGDNALGAMLGEGWWSGLLSYGTIWNHFGDQQSLLAKLVLAYEDGSRQVITTDQDNWRYFAEGPLVYSSMYLGEVYDATREAAVAGWHSPGFDDSDWRPVAEVSLSQSAYRDTSGVSASGANGITYDKQSLTGQIGDPARIFDVLTAKSVKEVRKGVYVYDMGQNLVGVPRITIKDAEPGQRMVLRVSEMLYPDNPDSAGNVGMIMTENYRAALSIDQYVTKAGPQTFQPHFTQHGFQYLEVSGLDRPLPLAQVQAVVISSVQALTASYESSVEDVNQLWSNLVWSNIDNFLTIPTDCPQRNERMGWAGDINVFARTATYLSDSDQFLRRYLQAMRDTQNSAGRFTDIAPVGGGFGGLLWGSAGITVPWELYQQYGDLEVLREQYSAMADYLGYLDTTLDEETGLSTDAVLGDWLGLQDNQLGPGYLATAYHVYDLDIMARVAELLGHEVDARLYRDKHLERKAFFNETFVNEEKKTLGMVGGKQLFPGGPYLGNGGLELADTQTSYAVGLALGVFDQDSVSQAQKHLAAAVARENLDDKGVQYPGFSLMTGFIGTAWISKALSEAGYSDYAYRLLLNDKYPSWLYSVSQGATTIWERLNGYTVENGFGGNNSMNSFNHYSFGAVGQWLLAHSLGIQRDEPGFKSFLLKPEPDASGQMQWARGYYDSPYGRIESGWTVDGQVLHYQASVPANTSATLYLPVAEGLRVLESGKPVDQAPGVTFVRREPGHLIYQVLSGRYQFEIAP